MQRTTLAFVGILVLAGVGQALGAISLDLTGSGPVSGTINGVFFQSGPGPAGTGIFDSFVRIQADGTEEGYNTSGRPVPFDEKTNLTDTHNILLGNVPILTNPPGTPKKGDYFEFLLDVNEDGDKLLSVDAIQLYTSSTGSQTTATVSSLGTLRYDLDGVPDGDSEILLDAGKYSGSGSRDLVMLVPVWRDANASDFLYLYSAFGGKGEEGSGKNKKNWDSGDGFEEWGVRTGEGLEYLPDHPASAPEPASLVVWLLLGALGATVGWGRRRKRAP